MEYLLSDATFWTAVSFILFILLVVVKFRGVVANAVNGRIERIRQELKEADSLRQDAKKILTELSEELESSEQQSTAIIDAARAEAETLQKQAKAKTDEFLARKLEGVKGRIKQEEMQARQDIHNSVVDRSVLVAEALLKAESDKISPSLFKSGLEKLAKAKLN